MREVTVLSDSVNSDALDEALSRALVGVIERLEREGPVDAALAVSGELKAVCARRRARGPKGGA